MLRFCCAESQEGKTLPACGMSTIGVTPAGNRGPNRRLRESHRGVARSFGDWGASQAAAS
jgi:hypothetical protein